MRRGGTFMSVFGVATVLGGLAIPRIHHAPAKPCWQTLVARREQSVQEARVRLNQNPRDWSAHFQLAYKLIVLRESYALRSTDGEHAHPKTDEDGVSQELLQVLDRANLLAATPAQIQSTEALQKRAFGPDYGPN